MADVMVLGAWGNSLGWSPALFQRGRSPAAPARPAPAGRAWLTAEDVAELILRGEFLDAGVSVPARFAPQALASAVSSVQRWTEEGRIFAVHELYPSYQFDERGRPYPAIERALEHLGTGSPMAVGNWFATPNRLLQGRRPQELLSSAPDAVLLALDHA